MQDDDMIVTTQANDFDKFFLAHHQRLRAFMLKRLAENEVLVNRRHDDTDLGHIS